ncbi:hypothetical protein [Nostoc sp.]|uniref:hypothetical protein n=1 Tax=Nostoc sp. TaxID=1180 RepID=UPI002FF5E3C1
MNIRVTQQTLENVGFRSSNATCNSWGQTRKGQVGKPQGRSGIPTYAVSDF